MAEPVKGPMKFPPPPRFHRFWGTALGATMWFFVGVMDFHLYEGICSLI